MLGSTQSIRSPWVANPESTPLIPDLVEGRDQFVGGLGEVSPAVDLGRNHQRGP
ncbi:MAG: hypothetical protein K2X97_20460 [Mycobacteriaceae bacterium]|nr:hypothetical protein [Mycobacteriaceae bacterium]